MAELTIKITHVSWRNGRPRFQPAKTLRDEGWKGEDLRHGPVTLRGVKTGPWYSPEECLVWVRALEVEIEKRRAEITKAKLAKRRIPTHAPARRSLAITVGDLTEAFLNPAANPRASGKTLTEGKRQQKTLSANTLAGYRQQKMTIEKFDEMIWAAPVDALTQPILHDLHNRLWSGKGLATARAVLAFLSTVISWGMRNGKVKLAVNPAKGLRMEMPEPRLRALTPKEVHAWIAAADATGRPEIGDCIMLGVWTAQRQNDRLAMTDAGVVDGRRTVRQLKTKAIVEIPNAPELVARLDAAKLRREGWKVRPLEIVTDEKRRRPWNRTHYAHEIAKVRQAAIDGIWDALANDWLLKPTPSLAGARDQDLRDTAVTWLARAGATIPEICSITGHSLQAAQQTLKHYLAAHPELSDNAIAKMIRWHDGQQQH